jgi:3-oxoacyl-[acyl-carrier protein] reductase
MATDPAVVLVTGSRKGIGRHLAEHFLAKGALVEGCSRAAADWSHQNYQHHLVDVADEKMVRKMVNDIRKRRGRIDIAVNCAGVASMNHSLLTPASAVDRVMETNVRGTFLVCREVAKLMQRRKYGRIINVGSIAAPLALEGEAIYAASKEAVVTLSRVLAREFAEYGITCNVVGPTPIDTDLIRGVPAEKIDAIVQRQAVKRLGTFEDVANVVDFFADSRSNFITGQVVYLGGV